MNIVDNFGAVQILSWGWDMFFISTNEIRNTVLFDFFFIFFFVVWKLCGDDEISSVHGSMVFELKKKICENV